MWLQGRNNSVHHMEHMWEDLKVAFKPLFVHLIFEAINLWSPILLNLAGFQKYYTTTFAYWGRNLEPPVKPSTSAVRCLTSQHINTRIATYDL